MYEFQASLGFMELKDCVEKELGADAPFTALIPDLSGARRVTAPLSCPAL